MRRSGRRAGQGTVEMVVAVPVLCLTLVLAWQAVAAAWTAVRTEEAARRAALRATGAPGVARTVTESRPLAGPLVGGMHVRVTATVLP